MHHIAYQMAQFESINFFEIYEALFVGFLTFISILVVAMLYRSEGLDAGLRSVVGDSKGILQKIKANKDKDDLCPKIYESALLDPDELRMKIERNLILLSGEDERQEANRIVRLIDIVYSIKIKTKKAFKNLISLCVALIVASLILMFFCKFLGFFINLIFIVFLIIFAIYILTKGLNEFFENINIFAQHK